MLLSQISDCRWQESLKRFQHIFDQSEGGIETGRQRPAIPVYTLPGNHDLGYEAMETANSEVLWCTDSQLMQSAYDTCRTFV